MGNRETAFTPDWRALDAYIEWIERTDQSRAKQWGQLYNACAEAAACEAMYWGALRDCGVSVSLNESGRNHRSPDFVCEKDGQKFYVEVTCIRTETAAEHTGLPAVPAEGASFYAPLNEAIFAEVSGKTRQCSNLDAPCVLAVGTFHFQASASRSPSQSSCSRGKRKFSLNSMRTPVLRSAPLLASPD
jgi:hypothetical protein